MGDREQRTGDKEHGYKTGDRGQDARNRDVRLETANGRQGTDM
jgi:hypothetical protein